ncbi:MAG: hypothetical protein RL308_3408 [Bacteroidota bacterium]|jgi:hypothetical protein
MNAFKLVSRSSIIKRKNYQENQSVATLHPALIKAALSIMP